MFVVLSEETEGDQGHGVVGPRVVQDFKQIDTFLKTVYGGLLAVFLFWNKCFGPRSVQTAMFVQKGSVPFVGNKWQVFQHSA